MDICASKQKQKRKEGGDGYGGGDAVEYEDAGVRRRSDADVVREGSKEGTRAEAASTQTREKKWKKNGSARRLLKEKGAATGLQGHGGFGFEAEVAAQFAKRELEGERNDAVVLELEDEREGICWWVASPALIMEAMLAVVVQRQGGTGLK
ncbi:hypothetical protein PIB30_079621 [Stylosanthes scabra]|uniref:Uncharacterized protein n=1 Tax=Stylosanthes scabra TaxID=79078 RepID=A0ABU6ZQF9_9FABA|nr:hypothetical protein [Stylosanthes scabra]